jgi:hypothetical protein
MSPRSGPKVRIVVLRFFGIAKKKASKKEIENYVLVTFGKCVVSNGCAMGPQIWEL